MSRLAPKPDDEVLDIDRGGYKKKTKRGSTNDKEIYIAEVEDYLKGRFEFRFNVFTHVVEYREIYSNDSWEQMTDYILNTWVMNMKRVKIKCSRAFVADLLNSDFAPKSNPLREYFEMLKWDGKKDYIAELSETITVVDAEKEYWVEYLRKWLVASMANVFLPSSENQTCLVLTGGQGKGKTTWLVNLVPKNLSKYAFCGKIDLQNKDTLTLLAENFIVNIDDQLRSINRKDEDAIKALITLPEVKYRRPYDKFIVSYPRIANFAASVNQPDFLTDPTGSRRFLAVQVLDINHEASNATDMEKVWAQAYHLFRKGFNYKFLGEDFNLLNERNLKYKVNSEEYEGIIQLFEIPENETDPRVRYVSCTEIMSRLVEVFKIRPSQKKVGQALKELGIELVQRTIGGNKVRVYPLIELDAEKRQKVFENKENQVVPF